MLLIGETGVGKSTLINAFANYWKFSSLEEAVRAGGVFPIPCTVEVTDPETDEMISVSSDGDAIPATSQTAEVGASVTQMPGVYTFQCNNTEINFIDTPGMNDPQDTSGHDKDKEHVSNILRVLSIYDEIHAICILVKASENRLSKALTYTLTELLKHLDRNACNNIIFIVTHVACTGFTPDKTKAVLQKFLKNNEIHIPLTKSTVYCFENETMSYLVQCKNEISQHDRAKKAGRVMNWEQSATSTRAMFDYICSLKPHSVTKINAIHNAEHTIDVLSKLVLETLMCIFEDENHLEQRKKEAEAVRTQITENPAKFASHDLRKLLYVMETKVVCRPLGYTNVVCEGPRCGKVVNGAIVYSQICCEHCKSLFMYFCACITWGAECKVCGCEKHKHKWKNTVTEIVTETVYKPQESVIAQIVDSDGALTAINRAIFGIEHRMKMWRSESEHMLRTCAQLNTFMHQNALIAHGDKLSMSLQDRIKTHERAKSTAKELKVLRQIQRQYHMFLFTEKNNFYRADDVDKLIQQIYKLPMKGNDLKRAVEVEEKTRNTVIEMGRTSRLFNLAPWRAQPRKLISAVSDYMGFN